MATYLNRADVQDALHVRSSKMHTVPWTDCAGDRITYNISQADVLKDYLEPVFSVTTAEEFRVLIFSGDYYLD